MVAGDEGGMLPTALGNHARSIHDGSERERERGSGTPWESTRRDGARVGGNLGDSETRGDDIEPPSCMMGCSGN